MPQNKSESLIYSVMMCFVMVLWMSVYNISLQMGGLSWQSVTTGWMGLPPAYLVAICCDMFLVSKVAKGVAFRYLVNPQSSPLRIVVAISTGMVVQMVIIMSLYGACEMAVHTGDWAGLPLRWLNNIPRNFIMALPLQLLIAGPLVRRLFRRLFPVGCIVA